MAIRVILLGFSSLILSSCFVFWDDDWKYSQDYVGNWTWFEVVDSNMEDGPDWLGTFSPHAEYRNKVTRVALDVQTQSNRLSLQIDEVVYSASGAARKHPIYVGVRKNMAPRGEVPQAEQHSELFFLPRNAPIDMLSEIEKMPLTRGLTRGGTANAKAVPASKAVVFERGERAFLEFLYPVSDYKRSCLSFPVQDLSTGEEFVCRFAFQALE